MSLPPLDRANLLARLARGTAGATVVVTPNRRLALALQAEFDAEQLARGRDTWDAPEILPLTAFLERLHDDALHADGGDAVPGLLAPSQEAQLWEDAIRASDRGRGLLAVAPAAEQCRAAWQLKHAWRIADGPGNEDAEAFAEWARAYLRRTAGELDAARLADAAAAWVDPSRLRTLVAYAFDLPTPQQRAFFETCRARGIEVHAAAPGTVAGEPVRAAFADAEAELDAAARWARARLEAGVARIGVVVPDLALRRRQVARIFSRVMRPGHARPGAPRAAMPFNLSAGEPLASYAPVQAALAILELAAGEVDFALASRVLRSPFLGGAESERDARALLDARLRRALPARLTLARLVGAVERCPLLRERLEALLAVAREAGAAPRSPHAWARHVSALLAAAGYPGERGLDSTEFQAHARWHEVLAEFARLSRVSPRMGQATAFARLRRLCAEALFQPESPAAPVQVLGILESAGLRFDALWVSGLTDEAWPLPARPNPFVPVALRRRAGVPEASAESSLDLDRRITAQWLAAAPEIVVSHALRDGERDLAPSPLVAGVRPGAPDIPRFDDWRAVLFAARRTEALADGSAPPLAEPRVRGGTRVLADQAACPFRAFARHRLGARSLEEPAEGPDAATRGTLLHALMAHLWRALRSSAALAADTAPAIEGAAAAAVADAGLEGRFAELERERLARLAREWLEVERPRPPFEVAAIEERRTLEAGGLALDGRIDRMDRLADGTHLLVDYKSGNVTRADWSGDRPLDPQLPLYALSASENVSAIAFARLKAGEMKFSGYGATGEVVDAAKDWENLRTSWRAAIDALGRGFARGDARVDPKSPGVCRTCDLPTLCRVHEKRAWLEGGEEDAE